VACREKLGNEDRPQISGTAGDEDFHKAKPIIEKLLEDQGAKNRG
jgi:hypothetical protein